MSVIRDRVDDLGVYLAMWDRRDDSKAQPNVTRAGVDATRAVDDLLATLDKLRERLISERRAAEVAADARLDTLLAARAAR